MDVSILSAADTTLNVWSLMSVGRSSGYLKLMHGWQLRLSGALKDVKVVESSFGTQVHILYLMQSTWSWLRKLQYLLRCEYFDPVMQVCTLFAKSTMSKSLKGVTVFASISNMSANTFLAVKSKINYCPTGTLTFVESNYSGCDGLAMDTAAKYISIQ